ncbi:MAG: hypothetical protein PVF58_15225 [Candidatus Methanofastidiosia archaeon]|jgi:hypothetical protein
MNDIVINGLKLLEISEMSDGIFWCRFWRTDEFISHQEDAAKLERIINSAIDTVPIEFIKCSFGDSDSEVWEKKSQWIKSVVLFLHANSEADIKEFLTKLSL